MSSSPDDLFILPLTPLVTVHLAINCTFVFLSVLVVSLRIYVRISRGTGQLWWDDWLCIVAEGLGVCELVAYGFVCAMGLGRPTTDPLVASHIWDWLFAVWLLELLLPLVIGIMKLSILCFYIRTLVLGWVKLTSRIAIVFVASWTLAMVLVNLVMCGSDIGKNWELGAQNTCSNLEVYFLANASINVLTDIIIFIIPLPVLWSLRLQIRQKGLLLSVFGVSLVVIVVSVVRLVYLTKYTTGTVTEAKQWSLFWACLEPNLGILVASIPLLLPLFFRRGLRKDKTSSPGGATRTVGHKNSGHRRRWPTFLQTTNLLRTENDLIEYRRSASRLEARWAGLGAAPCPRTSAPARLLGRTDLHSPVESPPASPKPARSPAGKVFEGEHPPMNLV